MTMALPAPGTLSFLIVGTSRSGTTLVQRLCAELPGVWVPAETHYWALADRARYRYDFPLRGADRPGMVNWAVKELDERTLGVNSGDILSETRIRDRRIGLFHVFESMVAAMSPPAVVLGEKTPGHIAYWEHLTQSQPHLKLVAVVRDPRAVYRSHLGVPWGERDAHSLAERWLLHQRSIQDAERILGPQRCLVARYEDIVSDTGAYQERLANFLEVPYQPQPLTDDLVTRYPLFAERESWKAGAMGAVTTDRVATWKGELTEEDRAIIEHTCGETMIDFGYEPSATAPAPAPSEDSRLRIDAYRHWYATVAALSDLPLY